MEKEKLKSVMIKNGSGMELEVLNYGATIKSLKIQNKWGTLTDVVVGLKKPEHYVQFPYVNYHLFLGCSVGRYAGRISGGGFNIDGTNYTINNEDGIHLHGGTKGFDKKIWNIIEVKEGDSSLIKLRYESINLEEGYPGTLDVSVTYELHRSNALRITYEAVTTKTTHVNLTNHTYFNLSGDGSILDQILQLNNLGHLEVDDQLIPTGHQFISKNTRFDFKVPSIIRRSDFVGFDDTFILDIKKVKAATLVSKKSGIKMEVFTNQPALVIYTPKVFPSLPFNAVYDRFPAIAFEAQKFPDAPNQKEFPNTLLNPGEKYKNSTTFKFNVASS